MNGPGIFMGIFSCFFLGYRNLEISHREIFFEFGWSKQNLDCIYPPPIDLALNKIPLGAKSFGKANYNLNFVSINKINNRINK